MPTEPERQDIPVYLFSDTTTPGALWAELVRMAGFSQPQPSGFAPYENFFRYHYLDIARYGYDEEFPLASKALLKTGEEAAIIVLQREGSA
jgi:hypothetical protein